MKNIRRIVIKIIVVCFVFSSCQNQSKEKTQDTNNERNYVTENQDLAEFTIAESGKTTPIVIAENDFEGVKKIAGYVRDDLQKVTTNPVELQTSDLPESKTIILAGTIGKSKLIDELIDRKKLDVSDIHQKWEASVTEVIDEPFPGIEKALVIAGSDKRGTIYGLFELSRKIGVSPWYWWSNVPISQKSALYVKAGRYVLNEPKVKYRGIFLNDEEPALGRWAVENYGGFNHDFYEKVFELILRLKGNYLWPAMWWASFNSDDPQNPVLANEMGIVMGTTHHEPMMRAHAEWKPAGGKDWNYETNETQLRQFWREGIERMNDYESIVTLAMRGDGDKAMSAETNTALLERIVADQRKIIEEVTGKPANQTPQLWALYKEVQDYYDHGMRVPDDVTLLLCDDNWGNIRKLPRPDAAPRSGGYGIYYHFDYVGGPRNYKWLNTSPLPRVWEQMHMAYQHGVDRIWLVNVGDLKPMELPISFFLDYAWNPDSLPKEELINYTANWAAEQFGEEHAGEIGEMLRLYTKYNGRRKPELLSPSTYSLNYYQEFERVVADYNQLAEKAKTLSEKLPDQYNDAYYQLVLHPIAACANLNELYYAAAKNQQAVRQGRATANDWAQNVRDLFQKDADITNYYHAGLANGKWNHMMAQTHIGYTYWQQPDQNNCPEVKEIKLPEKPEMGVAIQGSSSFWTEGKADDSLPEIDRFNKQSVYIDLFNRGQESFQYEISSEQPWVKISSAEGTVDKEVRIWVSADWAQVPEGRHQVDLKVRQINGKEVILTANISHVAEPDKETFQGFVESGGFVSMEAAHYLRKTAVSGVSWEEIPGLGKTHSAMAVFPVTAQAQNPNNSACLEYDLYLYEPGDVSVRLYLLPTLNYFNDEGLKIAVSFDNQEPVVLKMNEDTSLETWEKWVSNNINTVVSTFNLENRGKHTLKIQAVGPGVVVQKIVVHTKKENPSYLGEPESFYQN